LRNSGRHFRWAWWFAGASVLLALTVACLQGQTAQTGDSGPAGSPSPAKQQDQNIPDAPSTVQPAKPLPVPPVSPEPPQSTAPGTSAAETPAAQSPTAPSPSSAASPVSTPPVNIRTVRQGGATEGNEQNDILTIVVRTNQVVIPVTVTDEDGHLVAGLTAQDFTVLENGKKQKLNFFTADPFAISAAVVLDLGMKDVDLQKVNHTFPALEGAFSEFDELSVYTYTNTVGQLTGWGAVGPALSARLEELGEVRGENNGPPIVSGPMAAGGPVINGIPVDAGSPRPMAATQPARVLNDAILRAATDLAKRDKARRKVIFVISDGREYRSDASYQDVLRVLLSNHIMVYAIGVGTNSVPGFGTLSKLHLPRFGYTNILPKYVNATTGGQVFD
jgi:VWFA-related protein